eukprot:9927750-Ditylum_brightwellii.AAC.1
MQIMNDKILMDIFADSKPSNDTMVKLNAVRLCLGILTLANILNDEVTNIFPWALTGSSKSKTILPWQKQVRPSEKCLILRCRFLQHSFAPDHPCNQLLTKLVKLREQVGDWITQSPYTVGQYYFELHQNLLFELHHGLIHGYKPIAGRVTWVKETNTMGDSLPESAAFQLAEKIGSFTGNPLSQCSRSPSSKRSST